MKFISIDIECTGLNPEECQVLQIGAVIEDTENPLTIEDLPKFKCIVEHQKYVGQPVAITMNQGIFRILAELETLDKEGRLALRKAHNILPEGIVAKTFAMWLNANGIVPTEGTKTEQVRITVAGKNFATFDKLFLQKLPNWSNFIQIRQRILDPAILFMDWKNDKNLPNLGECLKRANIETDVTHDALEDAIDVVKVLRAATNNYERSY
jgi:DNA polymerase III epsilon subunit-like protein